MNSFEKKTKIITENYFIEAKEGELNDELS